MSIEMSVRLKALEGLVSQQGQLLKELSSRVEALSSSQKEQNDNRPVPNPVSSRRTR